jgi:hypothetical protein
MIKPKIRWASHVERVGDKKTQILVGRSEREKPLGRLALNEKIILELISEN